MPAHTSVASTAASHGTVRVLRTVAVLAVGVLLGVAAGSHWFQRPASQRIETAAAAAPTPTEAPLDITSDRDDPELQTRRDGMYLVGTDLVPGRYVARGIGPACYFAVMTDLDGSLRSVVASHFGDAFGRRVELVDGQYFETDDCGDWVLEATESAVDG